MQSFDRIGPRPHQSRSSLKWALALGVVLNVLGASAQTRITEDPSETSGPIRLQQQQQQVQPMGGIAPVIVDGRSETSTTTTVRPIGTPDNSSPMRRAISTQSEFEQYVQRAAGDVRVPRLGATLMTPSDTLLDGGPQVPPDYQVQPGDEVQVSLWGSVDADLRLMVDRSGRINVPRVGTIMVAGVRHADLGQVISQRVGTVFKNFQVAASMGRLRGQRIYVTGYVTRPGAYTVSSLSTLLGAVMAAGGPSTAGSFRDIQLRRGGTTVGSFDLYELLLKGDRSKDQVLHPDDVVLVGPVGPQVGVIGSVNRPAVLELKPNESLDDALRMVGGFAAVADRSRVSIERLDERASLRVAELAMPDAGRQILRNGDIVRAFNAVLATAPIQSQNRRVVIEGEVVRPGEYVVPAHITLPQAIRIAGGLTAGAYLYGTEFTRESVRATQQANYDRALRDLETELSRLTGTQRATTADEAAAVAGRQDSISRVVDRMRDIRPTGRIVLQMPVTGGDLPELTMEDGDRLYVPPRPSSVGVFGSVYNAGNYLHQLDRTMEDYLRLAGGPTKGADNASMFVIRANGTVISQRQTGRPGLFGGGGVFAGLRTEPGDTIFVPEEFDKSTFVQNMKDWSQILYQLGLGAAGLKALGLF